MEWNDKANSAIREAASEWVVRLGSSDLSYADRVAFAAWLRSSPVHVKEYLRAQTTWEAMDEAAQKDSSDIQTLMSSCPKNVTEIYSRSEPGQPAGESAAAPAGAVSKDIDGTEPQQPAVRSRAWLHVAAAIAATLVLTIGILFAPQWVEHLDSNTYSTAVGEQRRMVLPDGSAIELNTRSKVRLQLNARSRDVHLLEGEAFFNVAKDPSRPFRVLSDNAVVRAVGTQFNVYRQPHKTVVTVIEGQVAVARREDAGPVAGSTPEGTAPATGSAPVLVDAGSAVQIVARAAIGQAEVKPNVAVAWRQHRLVFENESLETVVAEFNRYNAQQLVIGNPQLAVIRISGTFDAHEPGDLVDFLTQSHDARALESDSEILLSSPQ